MFDVIIPLSPLLQGEGLNHTNDYAICTYSSSSILRFVLLLLNGLFNFEGLPENTDNSSTAVLLLLYISDTYQ